MSDLENILKECSIRDIYCVAGGTSVLYQIPVYQRNYAWGRDEICALIKDVYDSMESGKSVYYIGTLVTYKRDENVYEVIDGQQRLTTIYIILKAMGCEGVTSRLTYSARKRSATTIENLPNFGEECDSDIKQGFHYAEDGLRDVVGEKQEDKDKFREHFLNKVHIIHYRVPKDVDLNHYFEVMNSRGEQLEKHEIAKAKLGEQLKDEDGEAMRKFSQIWEACSDMSFYVQQKLPEKGVFGSSLDEFELKSFDDFPITGTENGNPLSGKTIADFLKVPVGKMKKAADYDKNDSFQPIIDFPNFLLVVLKITRMEEEGFDPLDFTLDDKELISEFDKVSLTPQWVKRFAYNLLRAKYYLDNYVIHHTLGEDKAEENPWKLQRYNNKDGKKEEPNDRDRQLHAKLVQLLSMFEVAFTAKQRKNYLFYCLLHLFHNDDLEEYLGFLTKLAAKFFFDVYLDKGKLNELNRPSPDSFDRTIIKDGKLNVEREDVERNFEEVYQQGSSHIPLFVFNYTDYRLWEKYADELRGEKARKGSKDRSKFFEVLGCSDFGLEPFKHFYFSRTRKSLEHYYPRAKAGEETMSMEAINCFGNFAMIGSDANSSGSNWNPIDKKNRYLDTKSNPVSVASLKFRIMLQKCSDNYNKGIKDECAKRSFGLEWNAEDMQEHQRKMLGIIWS